MDDWIRHHHDQWFLRAPSNWHYRHSAYIHERTVVQFRGARSSKFWFKRIIGKRYVVWTIPNEPGIAFVREYTSFRDLKKAMKYAETVARISG